MVVVSHSVARCLLFKESEHVIDSCQRLKPVIFFLFRNQEAVVSLLSGLEKLDTSSWLCYKICLNTQSIKTLILDLQKGALQLKQLSQSKSNCYHHLHPVTDCNIRKTMEQTSQKHVRFRWTTWTVCVLMFVLQKKPVGQTWSVILW